MRKMVLCDNDLDMSGLTHKWHKLRQRCASFKVNSGSSSLDPEEDNYILTEPPMAYTMISSNSSNGTRNYTSLHTSRISAPSPPTITRDDSYLWQKYPTKYEYREVNLNGAFPEKVNKQIPLPVNYWRQHQEPDDDRHVWMRNDGEMSPATYYDDLDYHGMHHKCNNMIEHRCERERLRYYTATDDNGNRKNSLSGGVDKVGNGDGKKEMRFLGLKAFKSASMRLPGQKSSGTIQEVQQLLRNKFNKINAGLRKRRALSVQEVFHTRSSSQPPATKPSRFYVPSPVTVSTSCNNSRRADYDDDADDDADGPVSLPYFINDPPSNAEGVRNSSIQLPAINSSSPSKPILRSHSHRITTTTTTTAESTAPATSTCTVEAINLGNNHSIETTSTASTITAKPPVGGGRNCMRERNNCTSSTATSSSSSSPSSSSIHDTELPSE